MHATTMIRPNAAYFINATKEKYPSIIYFIDIHRDSIKRGQSTVTIGDKNYAKVLFVVGF